MQSKAFNRHAYCVDKSYIVLEYLCVQIRRRRVFVNVIGKVQKAIRKEIGPAGVRLVANESKITVSLSKDFKEIKLHIMQSDGNFSIDVNLL